MHQRLQSPRDVAVVDEEVFLDVECCVTAFEIPGAIVFDAVPQNQVLRSCGRADRVSLKKTKPLKDGF